MYKNSLFMATAVLVVFLAGHSLAQAQAVRWVSNSGADSAACGSIASPCATFQQAHDNVAVGGQVIALTDGFYGATLNITKGVTIDGGGHAAVILKNTAGTAITVAAGSTITDNITIRGLTIDGNTRNGTDGIRFASGVELHVENTTLRSFDDAGILGDTSANSRMSIRNVTITDSRNGVISRSANGTTLTVDVSGSRFANNQNDGYRADSNSNTTIRDSVASGNQFGFRALPASGGATPCDLNIDDCVASGNTDTGIASQTGGSIPTVRVSRSTSEGNARGLLSTGGGALLSFGDNNIAGNGINGTFTPGVIPKS